VYLLFPQVLQKRAGSRKLSQIMSFIILPHDLSLDAYSNNHASFVHSATEIQDRSRLITFSSGAVVHP
jgi:hypothetical protein